MPIESTNWNNNNGQELGNTSHYTISILFQREAYTAMAEWLSLSKLERIERFSKRVFKKHIKSSYGTVQTNSFPRAKHKENDYIRDSMREKVKNNYYESLHVLKYY